tara:strand:- start:268 stop:900 length:633 start_codon:yes stop_codon:yes gene_type:complete
MKHLFSIFLVALGFNNLPAQEIFFNVGRNFTNYDYTNSQSESNPNIESSSGSSYELGYNFISALGNKFDIGLSCTLDQFNATGGNLVNDYSWNTNYFGLQGTIKYDLIEKLNKSKFNLNINAGINLNHIISGQQKINGDTFNLSSHEEFNGLFIKPVVGMQLKFYLTDDVAIGISYNHSKNYGRIPARSGDENLNFNNNQLQFGILMSTK